MLVVQGVTVGAVEVKAHRLQMFCSKLYITRSRHQYGGYRMTYVAVTPLMTGLPVPQRYNAPDYTPTNSMHAKCYESEAVTCALTHPRARHHLPHPQNFELSLRLRLLV